MLTDTDWVWSQYDHMLFLNTVEGPGGDAAVLRLKHPDTGADTGRALALTTDGNHLWGAVDPRGGAAMTVAESVMNLAVVGARPLALVNCLNFGNPEHPEVMWQLSEAVDGMTEALDAFGVPCVGGNVSLYNESRGRDIDPTPVVGPARHGRPAGPSSARRRPGRRRPAGAGRRDRARAVGLAVGRGPWPPWSRRAAGARPRTRSAPRRPRCASWSPPGWSWAPTTSPAVASRWPWPRWRSAPASASPPPGWPTTPRCSPSRRVARCSASTPSSCGSCSTCSRPVACPTAGSVSPAGIAWW